MNYVIKNNVFGSRYKFTISVSIPKLQITKILNFRVKSITLLNNQVIIDPQINNSNYIFEIKENQINKNYDFIFDFDIIEISNIKDIDIGFCDEFVRWYDQTVKKINVNLSQINLFNKKENNKICILSTWNIKCGISQYCKNFYDALIGNGCTTKVFSNTENYVDIFNFIKTNNFNIFIVQYEPSIIQNFEILLSNILILKRHNKRIKIYFVIHSEYKDLFKLDGIIDGFIYHKPNTLNFKNTKVNIIPMAVPIFVPDNEKSFYRQKYGIPDHKFVISTVGFMFGWKQHANVLQGMVSTLNQNKDVVIQLLTSFHSINNGECIEEYNKIRKVVSENNIESQVIHVTEYIPQQELSERLFLSDLGFLWSGIETTSSSASLKEFVSSRLPVVRTNSSHYHDIESGCEITGQDMGQFVLAIQGLISNKEKLITLKNCMNKNYEEMNYKKVISKFLEVFSA
jgi:hypothetical protein